MNMGAYFHVQPRMISCLKWVVGVRHGQLWGFDLQFRESICRQSVRERWSELTALA